MGRPRGTVSVPVLVALPRYANTSSATSTYLYEYVPQGTVARAAAMARNCLVVRVYPVRSVATRLRVDMHRARYEYCRLPAAPAA